MANWKNAPLIYTLGMIQFPRVPNIERFIDSFFDRIRTDFPLDDFVSVPVVSANVGPKGMEISQSESKMWQFCSIDRTWGFILNEQSLCLHTVKYHDSTDFAARLRIGLQALLQVPDIGIVWTTALGIRYVDLVQPRAGETLAKYLQPWLLPSQPADIPVTIVEGNYIARYRTEIGELRLQSWRNPPFTLSPELQSPFLTMNKWVVDRPDGEFALVDTDHGIVFTEPEQTDIDKILAWLKDLHEVPKQIFQAMGTLDASTYWRGDAD